MSHIPTSPTHSESATNQSQIGPTIWWSKNSFDSLADTADSGPTRPSCAVRVTTRMSQVLSRISMVQTRTTTLVIETNWCRCPNPPLFCGSLPLRPSLRRILGALYVGSSLLWPFLCWLLLLGYLSLSLTLSFYLSFSLSPLLSFSFYVSLILSQLHW